MRPFYLTYKRLSRCSKHLRIDSHTSRWLDSSFQKHSGYLIMKYCWDRGMARKGPAFPSMPKGSIIAAEAIGQRTPAHEYARPRGVPGMGIAGSQNALTKEMLPASQTALHSSSPAGPLQPKNCISLGPRCLQNAAVSLHHELQLCHFSKLTCTHHSSPDDPGSWQASA